eukprot:3724977-Rhodomonas_salina.1
METEGDRDLGRLGASLKLILLGLRLADLLLEHLHLVEQVLHCRALSKHPTVSEENETSPETHE